MRTYPVVDLMENSPIETRVMTFDKRWSNEKNKIILLNLNGYEKSMFSLINGSLFTSSPIDREEMVEKKRCLDPLYCLIEVHLIVNDAIEYWIVPIHILDENDNVPMFYQSEIELKFNEKIVNGYQIPFVGAKDIDEGPHSQIFYFLDCSPSIGSPIENQSFTNNNQTKSLSKNCSPLFELLILSQSSSTSSSHYDQLALKYRPSTKLAATRHEYHLILYAMDQHFTGHRRETSMKITVKIEEKEKFLKFSLSNYEFVLTLNETMNERVSVGRVYAMTNDPSERIHYQLISTMIQNKKTKDLVEINTFTGELFLQKRNLSKLVDEIQCHVQGSILHNKKSVESVQVKIYLRYVELLSEIFFDFQILSLNYLKMINTKDDHSSFNYSFFLDENIEPKETNLLQISLHSSFYPSDRYLLSLETYSKIFSLVSSSTSSSNVYQLQIKNLPQLRDQNMYELQFPVKHQLSQQWFSNLYIQLTLVDSLTTSTTTTTTTTTTTITTTTTMTTVSSTTPPLSEPDEQYDEDPIFAETKTIPWITLPIFTQPMSTERTAEMIEDTSDRSNSSTEWCNENHEYILYDIEPIGYLRVIEFTSIGSHNSSLLDGSSSIMVIRPLNENELMIEGCRMFIEPVNSAHFNRSVNLQLCSTVPAVTVCYNVTSMNPEPMKSIHEEMDVEEGFLSVRSIEIIISVISVIFVIISIILVFIICRLKGLNLCRMVQHYFYDHRYSFKRTPHLSSIKQTMDNMDPMIIDVQCRSSSFLAPKIKNDLMPSQIYDIDHHLWDQHAFSSPTIYLSSSASTEHLPALLFNPTNHEILRNITNEVPLSTPPPPPPSTTSSMTTTSSSFLRETKQLLDLISTTYQTPESQLISEV